MCDLFSSFIQTFSKKLSFASKRETVAYCTILLFFLKNVFVFIVTANKSAMSITLFY